MSSVVNIAAYKFVSLDALPELRTRLLAEAGAAGLKGTILLAGEGINLFLAGTADGIDAFLRDLRSDARFADLEVKFSHSAQVPFRKLLVKIKREIIRMDHPTIRPEAGRAPGVDAKTLARWLEQGAEVDEGTFRDAIDWRIDRFTQFPAAVQAHRAELEGKTVVSFCTGGIRCEKAAIYMNEAGIENVYQLDGGILKYFEETGGPGFDGKCFVFDERISLDPALAPSQD